MLASVPAWKIERWRMFERFEPFATERLEKQIAALFALYYNSHVEAKDRITHEDRLLIVPTTPPKELTSEQRIAAEQAAARAAAAADKARRGE